MLASSSLHPHQLYSSHSKPTCAPALLRSPAPACSAPASQQRCSNTADAGREWSSLGAGPSRILCSRGLSTVACAHGPSPPAAPSTQRPPARLAVFVSGGGSNFKAIHAACLEGRINGSVVVVVSDVPSCGGVQYAKNHNIPTLTYPTPKKGDFQGQGLTVPQLVDSLKQHQVDYVLLAGYLKLIPTELVAAYHRAMLNIHPGLLPSFGGKGMYGERVHQAVVASGARFSGPTVHFVDEEFDTGAILAQRVVPVYPTDTPKQLASRVLKEEWQVYPECVAALCDGRITWREDGIPILWKAH